MITIDTKEFREFSRHLQRLAKKVPTSIAGTLTSQAVGTRNTAIEEIERTMVSRTSNFPPIRRGFIPTSDPTYQQRLPIAYNPVLTGVKGASRSAALKAPLTPVPRWIGRQI